MSSSLLFDLRAAIRQLGRSTGFSAVSVAIFAIGTGATALAFSLIQAVLVDPLPYRNPSELFQVRTYDRSEARAFARTRVDRPVLDAWTADAPLGAIFAASNEAQHASTFYLGQVDRPERVLGSFVSPNFFDLLGTAPHLGRPFTARDIEQPLVVMGYGLWRRAFGGDSSVIGRTIVLSDQRYTVVAVMPPRFAAPRPVAQVEATDAIELWTPLPASQRTFALDRVIARVPPSVPRDVMEAALTTAMRDRGTVRPNEAVRLVSLTDELTAGSRPGLVIFATVVGLTLLLTCVNLAGLELARAVRRQHEAAVRRALGATRQQVARLVVLEGLVVAALGGGLGLLLTAAGLDTVRALAPAELPRLDAMRIDRGLIVFTIGISLIAGLATTLFPASALVRSARLSLLRGGPARPVPHHRAFAALVVIQLSLAVALVTGTGLLTRTMLQLWRIPTGIVHRDAIVIDVPRRRTVTGPVPATDGFYQRLADEARAIPGVTGVALASSVPFRPRDYYGPGWRLRVVDPGYFDLLGIALREGRGFGTQDRSDSPPVAVINRALAEQAFPGRRASGLMLDDRLVVGVVEDVRHESLDAAPEPAMYLPASQRADDRLSLLLRVTGRPDAALLELRRRAQALDAAQPLGPARSLDDILAASAAVARRRFFLEVLIAVGAVAALLSALGVYSVTSQSVTHRTPELGIRMSLGATPGTVVGMVVRQAGRLLLLGSVVGILGAAALSRALRSLLYGVSSADPVTVVLVALLFGVVVLLASAGPARRAAAIDPVRVVRDGG